MRNKMDQGLKRENNELGGLTLSPGELCGGNKDKCNRRGDGMKTRSLLVFITVMTLLNGLPLLAQSTSYDGVYQGRYKGDDVGSWQISIVNGGISGWCIDSYGWWYELNGDVNPDGFLRINTSSGGVMTGFIKGENIPKGTWTNQNFTIKNRFARGTFTGNLVEELENDKNNTLQVYDDSWCEGFFRIIIPEDCGSMSIELEGKGCALDCYLYNNSDVNGSPILSDEDSIIFPKRLVLQQPQAGVYYLKLAGYTLGSKPVNVKLKASYNAGMWDFMEENGDVEKISLIAASGKMIQANVPTWVLIHGMNSKPNVFFELGTALDGLAEGDQVLFVDWERAAKSLKLSNTKWIIPAAEKLVPLLNQIGVTRSYLDVVGHSWGTYMAYEIGKQIGGGDAINRLVALDPALKGEGYDFERIDFGAVSSSSLAFRSDGVFGNADIPKTADHSIVVGTKPVSKTLNLGVVLVGHSAVRDVYTSIINSNRMGKVPDQISVKLSPNKMASDPGWQADRFAPAGMAMGGGGYEAVLLAPNKKTPSCLYYYNSSGEVESLPKANSGGGGESFGEF